MYDIYLYTYYKHRVELFYSLKTIGKYVNYNNCYVVYDDIFCEERLEDYTGPIDWTAYEQQLGNTITVIPQSSLYDWAHEDIINGWLRQQYAKMLVSNYSKKRYNIICDSECIFVKPYTVFDNGVPILYHDNEWELSTEYFEYITKYTGQTPSIIEGTYVGSCSLWDNELVANITDTIQNLNNKDFIECVREHVLNTGDSICFSEFETYGIFAQTSHVIRPKNYQYITDSNFVPKIKDNIELLIFSDGFSHRLSEFKSHYGC